MASSLSGLASAGVFCLLCRCTPWRAVRFNDVRGAAVAMAMTAG